MTVRNLPVGAIEVNGHHRALRGVEELAASIGQLGLLNPLTVTRANRLVAGRHRLEAVRRLGWDTVPCRILDLDDLQAELAMIDENLVRNELTVLERAEQLKRRKEIYEALHPEAKPVNERGGPGRGHKKTNDTVSPVSFAEDAAAKAGVSARTVEREVQIASSLAEEAKEVLRDTPVADCKKDLLGLAKIKDQAEQVEAARKLASGKAKTTAQARVEVRRDRERQELQAKAAEAPASGDSWQVIRGDCLDELPRLRTGSVRLAFADPQYNIGWDYGEGAAADRLPDGEYLDGCRQRLALIPRLLTADGSLWLLVPDEYAEHFALMLTGIGLHRQQWLIWYEPFGVLQKRGFGRCHRHLFWYVKDPGRFVFHETAVLRPSDRQAKYNDARAQPSGKVWDSVWGVDPPINRVAGTFGERIPGFPTQLPVALLEAIIGCATDPGDLVLDPYSGSGTAGEAALRLGRQFVGIEQREDFARLSRARLKGVLSRE